MHARIVPILFYIATDQNCIIMYHNYHVVCIYYIIVLCLVVVGNRRILPFLKRLVKIFLFLSASSSVASLDCNMPAGSSNHSKCLSVFESLVHIGVLIGSSTLALHAKELFQRIL